MKAVASLAAILALIAPLGMPTEALAWGATGHRMIGVLAVRALPAELPAFLHGAQAATDVGELSREPDRSKSAGRARDSDLDPAHFLDLGDDGKILGGPTLAALPPTRADYEAALRAAGQDEWKAGYLPYSIVEAYQLLAKDFAIWRALQAAEANPAWAAHHDWFATDSRRRETQILDDIGQLSHFVGDGSQPLHVTVHYNGWGDFPNPDGFSNAKLHGPFEGDLVRARVSADAVAAAMPPPRTCDCSIETRVAGYLTETGRLVIPFYIMEKAGGLAPGDPRGPALATRQLAVGAAELRDLIAQAWRVSLGESVGYRPVAVADVLAGRVDPYDALYGVD